MAEIEHFLNPDKRSKFPKFASVADLRLTLYTAHDQLEGNSPKLLRLGDAVKQVSEQYVCVCVCEFRQCDRPCINMVCVCVCV